MSTEPLSRDQRTFARRLKEARVGDPAAQYEVALMYANGVGVEKSVEQAMTWTESSAKKGHVAAQYLLGTAYQGGLGVKRNSQRALTWLLKAAESGSDKAPLKLARFLTTDSFSVSTDYLLLAAQRGVVEAQFEAAQRISANPSAVDTHISALELYQSAAEGGIAAAQVCLAEWLERGAGDSFENLHAAVQWYRRAAGQGHPGAQLALARLDAAGEGRIAADNLSSIKINTRKASNRERRRQGNQWDVYANSADAREQFHLGQMYQTGCAVPQDERSAQVWFERAANQGFVDAQWALAELIYPSAPAQAFHWYLKAAQQGHTAAQLAIARCLRTGIGHAQSLTQASEFYGQAAAQGNTNAQYELANLLRSHSPELAMEWLIQAARGGLAQAQYELGERYAKGFGLEQDWLKATDYYARAAAQANADAQCALAACFAEGLGVRKDMGRALALYESAVEQDHPRALWSLGEWLAHGVAGVSPDARKATLYCKRAANAGFAPAQSTLAALFAKAKKYERAVHWWSLAAKQNDPEALFNLAHAYRMGWAPSEEDEALELLQRAARTGLVAAQARLGLCYATGDGAPLDPIEAAKWFVLAARAGDLAADSNSKRAQSTLSPSQWREALRRVDHWSKS